MVRSFLLYTLLFCFTLFITNYSIAGQSEKVKALSDEALLTEIVKLDLGLEQYRIGKVLTPEQLKKAEKHAIKKRYQGTIKYKDGDVGVVADASNNTILALFLENKEASQVEIKNMIATLMMTFGQPTTMAHEKIVYWAFNEKGLISEEVHSKAKNVNELNILATVKFNSKSRFMERGQGEEKEKVKEEGTSIYCIVSSPALLERFSKKR